MFNRSQSILKRDYIHINKFNALGNVCELFNDFRDFTNTVHATTDIFSKYPWTKTLIEEMDTFFQGIIWVRFNKEDERTLAYLQIKNSEIASNFYDFPLDVYKIALESGFKAQLLNSDIIFQFYPPETHKNLAVRWLYKNGYIPKERIPGIKDLPIILDKIHAFYLLIQDKKYTLNALLLSHFSNAEAYLKGIYNLNMGEK